MKKIHIVTEVEHREALKELRELVQVSKLAPAILSERDVMLRLRDFLLDEWILCGRRLRVKFIIRRPAA